MAKTSATFRKVRKGKNPSSESFRSVPKPAATQPDFSERPPVYTLSVLEVLELFKNRGVGVTERTVINWCHPNDQGVARLTAWKDPNESKWFVTPQSVEYAILEEQKKLKIKAQSVLSERNQTGSETHGSFPKGSEGFRTEQNSFGNVPQAAEPQENPTNIVDESAYRDLQITNQFKNL